MKTLFKFKYPKLILLLLSIIIAYLIFSNHLVAEKLSNLNSLSYLAVFIAGIFFSFGFTAPLAVGFFLVASPPNILLAAILGGFGAMLSDLTIFSLIRFSFMEEFNRLKKTKKMKQLIRFIDNKINHKIRIYMLYSIAGIAIASPLPDELGVMMLAGLTKIKANILAIIGFILNTIGILILLYI